MRASVFKPRSTSLASAPAVSQIAAISLAKVTDMARKALIACFVISADSTDIHSMRSVIGRQAYANDDPFRFQEGVQRFAQAKIFRGAGEADDPVRASRSGPRFEPA